MLGEVGATDLTQRPGEAEPGTALPIPWGSNVVGDLIVDILVESDSGEGPEGGMEPVPPARGRPVGPAR